MTTTIPDQHIREQALDPAQSFIVQAPAGSGKTSLLTQRFLRLLAIVQQPESIVAITFTRKAAEEMRSRIIESLQSATETEPESSYAKQTWQLAKKALLQDQENDWQLLQNPNRLNIQTIDALCARLTQAMPILSRFGANPRISEQPQRLYQQAVHQALQRWMETPAQGRGDSSNQDDSTSEAFTEILLHLDNNIMVFERLMVQLLARRDQWLPYLLGDHQEEVLTHSWQQLITDHMTQAFELIDNESKNTLATLIEYSQTHLGNDTPNIDFSTHTTWQHIASITLTKTGTWRKSIDKRTGFPAASSFKNKEEKAIAKQMKTDWSELLESCQEETHLQSLLADLARLPCDMQGAQWPILQSMMTMLPCLAAELTLVFKQHSEVDFTEITLRALDALGDDMQPTDLAQRLDYQLQHLLIDEFQDTSQSQFRLFEKLVAAWQPDDGHSLFCVGDPMQSIYRFREADVSLFLRAQQCGIGPVFLNPLTLTVNFRSQAGLIDWFNQTFSKSFPAQDRLAHGAVRYTPAIAMREAVDHAVHVIRTDEETALLLGYCHQHQQENPEKSLAILVKSRSHLMQLLPALRQENIAVQAVELEYLADRPALQDIMSLARSINHLGDRLAWLAVLRAPWCGLNLKDLTRLAGDDRHKLIFHRLQDDSIINSLSDDAQQRLKIITPILLSAQEQKYTQSLAQIVEHSWHALQGLALLDETTSLIDVQTCFAHIAACESAGILEDVDQAEIAFSQLFATQVSDSNIHLMTLHKSKGLEFDTVILPSLHKSSRTDAKPLLYWKEHIDEQGQAHLLMAPMKASTDVQNPWYDYLRTDEQRKAQHELCRLMYVAATRAKQHLVLISGHDEDGEPNKGSLLGTIWGAVNSGDPNLELVIPRLTRDLLQALESSTESVPGVTAALQRIPLSKLKPHTAPITDRRYTQRLNENRHTQFTRTPEMNTLLGTVFHFIVQQSTQNPAQWPVLLTQFGMPASYIPDAITALNTAYQHMQEDEKGQWLLSAEGQRELAVSHHGKRYVIDRVIETANTCWIIDYKFTVPSQDEPLTDFLQTQVERYTTQLQQYADILSAMGRENVQCALYFPLLPAWQTLDCTVVYLA